MGDLVSGPFAAIHAASVPALPPRRSELGRSLLAAFAMAIVLGWAGRVIELRPLELVRDIGNVGVFLRGYLHPSFANIGEYAWQCVITICIALWGTVMAVTISVPLGLLGARASEPVLRRTPLDQHSPIRRRPVDNRLDMRSTSHGSGFRYGPRHGIVSMSVPNACGRSPIGRCQSNGFKPTVPG